MFGRIHLFSNSNGLCKYRSPFKNTNYSIMEQYYVFGIESCSLQFIANVLAHYTRRQCKKCNGICRHVIILNCIFVTCVHAILICKRLHVLDMKKYFQTMKSNTSKQNKESLYICLDTLVVKIEFNGISFALIISEIWHFK